MATATVLTTECEPSAFVDHHERVRAYEIAAYLSAASFPFDIPEGPPSSPVPSSDITLNALVQHGVYKMDCDRAFLSLIDNRSQFICAEMTRNQTLGSPDPTQPLLLGTARIALEWGVCPYTMSVFHGKEVGMLDSPYIVANKQYFYIQDFRKIPQFVERPFVAGYPHMVSYIEIPLTSISGHILGSYCVVDSRERDFLLPKWLDTIREVTSSISSYLDMKRVKPGQLRSERMIDGLRQFIDPGRPTATPKEHSTKTNQVQLSPFDLGVFGHASKRDTALHANDNTENELSSDVPMSRLSLVASPHDSTVPAPELASLHSAPEHMSKTTRMDLSAKIDHLFSKAAGMIGYAMDLDGLVFYDAVATGAQHRSSNLPSMFADDVTSLPAMHGDQTLAVPLSQYRQDDTAAKDLTHQLSQSLIRHLTTAYPQGHVFAVDEYGIFETEAKHSSNEWSELFECVPQARYVMFLPLWHYQRESCYATCLTWVSETGKTLDSNDINSLAAFDNSLMAEIFRLEASTNTQSKSDFVSSISHELRSPLHGILATTELMQENMDDSKMLTMIGMIESCSNTLLDTFDHLLEFSNVNSRTNNSQDAGTRSSDSSAHGQANTIASDLESLVEDVLEAVLLGHTSAMRVESDLMEERQDTPTKEEKPTMPESVIVTTNIAQERNWTIPIEKGAWKRMLLNIFSNALKYTNSGHVDVTLALLDKVDQRPPQISLSVTDTGIGMSHEFLKYQLFTPFTQENSLSPGTGLGLSIVKSIVESLHGKVFVESRLHEGTRVTINIPWDENPSSIGQPHSSSDSGLEGLSIGLFSMSSQGQPGAESTTHIASPTPVLERSIRSICEAKIGMTVSTSDTSEVDILLIDTHALVSPRKVDLETLLPQNVTRTRPQALVLLGVSEASMAQHFDIKKATYLVSPITKKRLCAALASAVEKAKSLNDSTSNSPATENKENTPTLPISTIAETTPSTQISSPPQPPSPKPLPRSLTLPTNPTPSLKPSPTPPQTCRFHHLLLVDDNPINLKLLVAFARRLSLPYTTAADGAEAVRLYQNAALSGDAFDCVFMDISMPVMDGFQAVEEIRKFEKRDGGGGKRCFVFALTGLGSEKARREAGRAGCDEFLLKPVRFRDVGVLLGAEYG